MKQDRLRWAVSDATSQCAASRYVALYWLAIYASAHRCYRVIGDFGHHYHHRHCHYHVMDKDCWESASDNISLISAAIRTRLIVNDITLSLRHFVAALAAIGLQ